MNVDPPRNTEAERAVLGAILLSDETSIPSVLAQGLRPDDFYYDTHQNLFEAICNMHTTGRHVDTLTLAQWVQGRFDRATIDELAAAPFSVGHLPEYARIVIDCAFLRRMRETALAILKATDRQDVSELRVQVGRAVSLLPKDGPKAVERRAA